MNPYVKLARKTIETYIKTGKIITCPEKLPKELQIKAGAFVSIYKLKGALRGSPRRHALATRGCKPREQVSVLRGCIGTFLPTKPNLAEEIINNAICACSQDPRFEPIQPEELKDITFSVDILSEPEPIHSLLQLDVKKYGVIVESGNCRGLLLPNLEGITIPQQQVAIAMQKAGLSPTTPIAIKLYRFTSKRYSENDSENK